jgi:large subunit ribosomal protein L29
MEQSEVKELSKDQLREEIDKNMQSYFELKRAHAISPLENPMQLRETRRSVARLKTEMSKRDEN